MSIECGHHDNQNSFLIISKLRSRLYASSKFKNLSLLSVSKIILSIWLIFPFLFILSSYGISNQQFKNTLDFLKVLSVSIVERILILAANYADLDEHAKHSDPFY